MIDGGDWEANYAYYALLKFHMLPSVFLEMGDNEKAFVIAAIKTKLKSDKERAQEIKRKTRRK